MNNKKNDIVVWIASILILAVIFLVLFLPSSNKSATASNHIDKNDIKAWENAVAESNYQQYLDSFPHGYYYSQAIDSIYKTDSLGWEWALRYNTANLYKEYLLRYPHGKHAVKANKYAIDLEVDSLALIATGEVPPSIDELADTYIDGTSRIYVANIMPYPVKIRFSGIESKEIFLNAIRQTNEDVKKYDDTIIILKKGMYRVVSTIQNGPSSKPFYSLRSYSEQPHYDEFFSVEFDFSKK